MASFMAIAIPSIFEYISSLKSAVLVAEIESNVQSGWVLVRAAELVVGDLTTLMI
tara:strand:- start:314 stop:478 length:165 start_codon:yes stop_codon:yes gene_type:complete